MPGGLTPTEDAELRRLHFFRRFGVVATKFARRYDELRGRDRRLDIREPAEVRLTIDHSDDAQL
ncbi:MAG TPA: hypothetical protein VH274_00295 [Mycobacteriales bacterium]|nr:hypothetical protein [Mycobacteriales bacterium]